MGVFEEFKEFREFEKFEEGDPWSAASFARPKGSFPLVLVYSRFDPAHGHALDY
jgi:hypothetical protein